MGRPREGGCGAGNGGRGVAVVLPGLEVHGARDRTCQKRRRHACEGIRMHGHMCPHVPVAWRV